VIAYQQRLFHGAGGDLVVLEQENIDDGNGNDGKDQCVYPFYQFAVGPFPFFPETPVDFFADVYVIHNDQTEKEPVILEPDHPKDVDYCCDDKVDQISAGNFHRIDF
jgi:hypothetical protein